MIVGTAGHIDHGKTTLVKALTGVDTDRLKEEKARGITIDLGYAYLPLPDGGVLGFVDVPGHERFVRNMLAGATGIDFVLLVIAADDGVMPQSREHFEILRLLGLDKGLVALTKCDQVSAARIAEVEREIRALLAGTRLEGAAIIPVSALSGDGVASVRKALFEAARGYTARGTGHMFRLAVDRRFSLQGVGTIVTGPVMSGRVRAGDTVTISPGGLCARVRSIHAQDRSAGEGRVGDRCALNLVGDSVHIGAIRRGDVVLAPEAHAPAERIDAELSLLDGEPRALAHWTPVRFHHGAGETSARIALLQEEPIAPGATGRVQVVLERPVAAAVGDRFVIRDTSGSRTMGGGRLIDLRAPSRRRKSPGRLTQLEALAQPGVAATLAGLLACAPHAVDIAAFARDRLLGDALLTDVLAVVPHVRVTQGSVDLVLSNETWVRLERSARGALETFHRSYPQLLGPGIARLGRALDPKLTSTVASAVLRTLVANGTFAFQGGAIRLPGHRLALDPKDLKLWQKVEDQLSGERRFRPPQGRECAKLLGEREMDVRRVLKAMARQAGVIEVAPDRFFLQDALREMAGVAADIAETLEDGFFTAAQFRDRLHNGRKVAIEILEYFDRNGLTVRRGDLRRVVPQRIADYAGRAVE